jgi:uncharacterized protein YjdB
MKKLYALLSGCLLALTSVAQTTTVTVNATGAAGSYKTGWVRVWNTISTFDGDMNVKFNTATTATNGMRRGWAVFNTAGLVPPGASVTAASVRFTISNAATGGNPTCAISGWAGDMSTIAASSPGTVATNCSGTAFNSSTWGGGTGTLTKNFNATGVNFVNTNIGTIFSICFSATSTPVGQIYTVTGETGSTSTQPQLAITYSCTGVTGVTASLPAPVCLGSTFTLAGAATGAGSYSWSGPGGFSSTDQNPSLTATTASAGVYSFTAYYNAPGGCGVTTTLSVAANTPPTAITGNTTPCAGSYTTLSSSPATGTWSYSSTSGATMAGNVLHAGSSSGATTVTYTLPSGCAVTAGISTLDTPTAIVGPSSICSGIPTNYTSSPLSGVWNVNPSGIASIHPATGSLTGLSLGSAVITYTGPNTCTTTRALTVLVPPNSIVSSSGSFDLCPSLSFTLTDDIPGGTWSTTSGNISLTSAGVVTANTIGLATVTYSNICGSVTADVNVTPPPDPITGVFSACVNASSLLHNTTPGGLWTSSNPSIAAAAAGFGTVTGVSQGTANITYTAPSGCVAITPFTVKPIPGPIQAPAPGFNACASGGTRVLFDDSTGGIWSTADPFIATIESTGKVHGVSAATTTITYTYPATGCYVTAAFTVNPLPVAITGNNAMCRLTSDTLYDLSLGGTWTSNNGGIAAISSTGVVTGVSAGTTTITYTLPTGCYRTRPVTIHPLPNPSISFDWYLNTFSVPAYYVSYQWYYNGNEIPGAVSRFLAATENGNYAVHVVDTFGCENTSPVYVMTNLAVDNFNSSEAITVAPNPTTGNLIIRSSVKVNAVVTGVEGKVLMTQNDAHALDISSLPDGIYMIMLTDEHGNKLTTRKIVKQQ